jgi:hypothetical protein
MTALTQGTLSDFMGALTGADRARPFFGWQLLR